MNRSLLVVASLMTLTATPASASPELRLVYETGPAYIARNDGRYGADGTPYDADTVGQRDNLVRGERTSVELASGRHRVIALYAPFQLATRVTLADDLRFRDTTFAAGAVVDHTYKFDGYRASYLYRVLDGTLAVELGGSLQVRDAAVVFSTADGTQTDRETDIGLVPALKARITYAPGGAWAALEADGLSTFGLVGDTRGAIYDVALFGGLPIRRGVDVYGNLRLLGGGAEVPDQEIDNWGDYLSASIGVRLQLGG